MNSCKACGNEKIMVCPCCSGEWGENEMDTLRARVAELEADRNSWKAIAEKRHDILLGVEWSGEVEAEAQSEGCCPHCLAYSDRKHEVGCKMAEAIVESARAANGENTNE